MLAWHAGFAQKLVRHAYPVTSNTLIQIDTDNCYQAEISSYEGANIIVEARMEGEYAEAFSVNISEEGKTVWIAPQLTPEFEFPNDKLSAHKVVSLSLKVKIPSYQNVQVFGTSCNVSLTGAFNEVDVVLNDGNCTLNQVARQVQVNTQSGNILLNSFQGMVRAVSHYGQVKLDDIPKGDKHYDLETVSGNISLNRTK